MNVQRIGEAQLGKQLSQNRMQRLCELVHRQPAAAWSISLCLPACVKAARKRLNFAIYLFTQRRIQVISVGVIEAVFGEECICRPAWMAMSVEDVLPLRPCIWQLSSRRQYESTRAHPSLCETWSPPSFGTPALFCTLGPSRLGLAFFFASFLLSSSTPIKLRSSSTERASLGWSLLDLLAPASTAAFRSCSSFKRLAFNLLSRRRRGTSSTPRSGSSFSSSAPARQ